MIPRGGVRLSAGPLQAMAGEYTDRVFHRQAIQYWLKPEALGKKIHSKKLYVTDAPGWLDTVTWRKETRLWLLAAG
jgi:hypothetical protein